MPPRHALHFIRNAFRGRSWQTLAIMLCMVFGAWMIANTQMGGEGMWFWYAQLFHGGVKLYADMHLVLQPLYVLQADAWIQMFGTRTIVTEIPSLIQVLLFCIAILSILHECSWPDWQKAVVLSGAFMVSVQCTAYRFDDYHLSADTFVFFAAALLLLFAKSERLSQQLGLAAGLGVLSALTTTTRLNDGVALFAAVGVCMPVLARRRKLLCVSSYAFCAVAAVALVIMLTGDTFRDYAAYSIFKAAGSKGGPSSILSAPFLLFRNALSASMQALLSRKKVVLTMLAVGVLGALLDRYRRQWTGFTVLLQTIFAGLLILCSRSVRDQLFSDAFLYLIFYFCIWACYLLAGMVIVRYLRSAKAGETLWDRREILILLPLAELASASASTAAQAFNGFLFAQIAMLLLLFAVLRSKSRRMRWVDPSLVTLMALLGVSGAVAKVENPYSWLNYKSSSMFQHRQMYRHPVYGTMYIDSDLLHFIQPVCAEIVKDNPHPEVLSLPYSYPNYFCDTSPWHGYVQTFFDTTARSTIYQLMDELNAKPPQWIVYQRQVKTMTGQQAVYSPHQQLGQQDLDAFILKKIADGEWQLVENRRYLEGDGWLIIKTRP